jgi:hypothetical protein
MFERTISHTFLSLERAVDQVPATLSAVSTLRTTILVDRSRTLDDLARAFPNVNRDGEADRSSVAASD